ncbi:SCO family protein [Candidatus Methylospira mobilis]|uniref:SCO family protein n=2 Tax=Candidatus Methylospira mobilis TaxID=1808979 RepID=A0A5Q0BN88_9GAMM|nr:SCO family protein [Candidatus Methylospira mobilis]
MIAACSGAGPQAKLPAGGDFILQSADGPFDTQAQRGKVLLLYFGYTSCPDNCSPIYGAQALKRLSAEERARVRMVLVTVDPQRDTTQRLKDYTAYFHPEMIGVTGTVDEIDAVAKRYGVGYEKQPVRPNGSYAVDHSQQTYVIAPDGKLAAVLGFDTPVEKVVAAVRKLL